METIACCHQESSPEPPHARTSSSSSSPPPSCSSCRDEAVDTNHAAIGARMKPLEPPEVSPLRGRETHVPSQSAGAAAHSGHSPPSPTTVRRSRRDRPPSVRRREAVAVSLKSHFHLSDSISGNLGLPFSLITIDATGLLKGKACNCI
ncbi:hypothetical protein DY000_02020255 [Brassica cretica]|uniref:AT-hook motif nuclear-localized protein n=1 Tax=Brassica cretica TaxID=69181 RepID=A0ABQ7EBE5_BRACR|nr:hypothetical protein DY000_02020255 [Brassica cretica]